MTTRPTPREIIVDRCHGSYVNMTAGTLAAAILRDLYSQGYIIEHASDLAKRELSSLSRGVNIMRSRVPRWLQRVLGMPAALLDATACAVDPKPDDDAIRDAIKELRYLADWLESESK